MRLVKPSVELLQQRPGKQGMFDMIELAGRTCYKSEDYIKYDEEGNSLTSRQFFDKVVNSYHHNSISEHGTVYITVDSCTVKMMSDPRNKNSEGKDMFNNVWNELLQSEYVHYEIDDDMNFCFTTNYRYLLENDLVKEVEPWITEPSEFHEKRYSFRIICDRAIANELVRHRKFSFSQESTRYCNYSKDKFNNELTFIIPYWMNLYYDNISINSVGNNEVMINGVEQKLYDFEDTRTFERLMEYSDCEDKYLLHIHKGEKPEDVRAILHLGVKTEIVMTGFKSDWDEFFKKRCSSKAHPDMQIIANKIKELIYG
jgi:thymidylate synthase (FAD)